MKENLLHNYKIGIIGYGKFGKVLAEYLFPNNTIYLFTPHKKQTSNINKQTTIVTSLQELVHRSDIIIPAVPIRAFENVIKEISAYVTKEKTIIDVCSVKVYPVAVMKKYLSNKANYIATHPMFGPNSIQKRQANLLGLKIVMYPIQETGNLYTEMCDYFTACGLEVIDMTPEEHDKYAAYSQFFALTIGQMAQELSIINTPIDTPGADALVNALGYMGPDKTIIEDMLMYNIYCKKVLESMIDTLHKLQEHIPNYLYSERV